MYAFSVICYIFVYNKIKYNVESVLLIDDDASSRNLMKKNIKTLLMAIQRKNIKSFRDFYINSYIYSILLKYVHNWYDAYFEKATKLITTIQ